MRLAPLLLVILFFMPQATLSQAPPGMDSAEMMRLMQDPAAMQRMMEEADKASKCMEGIEKSKIDALQRRGEEVSREIERLCAAGKRDEAMAYAMKVGKEMNSDPTVKKMRACTKDMSQMLEGMPVMQLPGMTEQDDARDEDICS